MNRILTFKNVKLNIGHIEGNKAVADRITENYALSNIDIEITRKYFNLQNECIIECDLKSTYGMIGYLLNIPFGDLYYLFSEKQTVTKEEILHRLIEEDVIKNIVLNNLKELR